MSRLLALIFCLFTVGLAIAGVSSGSSPDPFTIIEFPGQSFGNTITLGYTQKSSIISSPSTTAVIVILGQSNVTSNDQGTFTSVNAGNDQLNVYDGGVYGCAIPVLGAGAPISTNTNSPNCQIGDSLITNGVFTRVITVSIGINGTLAADWNGVPLSSRITAAWKRMQARGYTPNYILWHQGEQDNINSTGGSAYTTSVQAVASQWRALGYTGPFFVAEETLASNAVSATIQTAQANAVSSPLHIVAGANWDSLTGGTNRYDGTHFTGVGSTAAAALDVTIITNCKNTSC